ncbi:MAG: YhcH/YjgK/YiaL family protein [Bacteroidaceae bacterium]|jgi:YhcH/YjgK/YiaL family protein|nr:YhcH/YjgK/YiaL family protein [Bacteroidaceae bacterium]
MVLDSLDNLEKYVSLNPLFSDVVDYIRNNDLAKHEPGKEFIKGNDLFVNFSIAKGKNCEEAKLETHNQMIDIQIPISCAETMGYTPRKDLPEVDYNADKDISFYEGPAQQYITVEPGSFAIFFPQDGHAPCISKESQIQKIIFKVKA